MGLIIYKDSKGGFRPYWWGRVTHKGKSRETNLNVKIQGVVPVDAKGNVVLSATGDEAFEASRKAANKALETWRKEVRSDKATLQKKAFKAQTGESLDGVPFAKLIDKWLGINRQRTPTAERIRNARKTFQRFGDFARRFAARKGFAAETLNDVTGEMVAAWFAEIKGEYAFATVCDQMHLMKAAFDRWSTNGQKNPFGDVVLRASKESGEEKRRTQRKALTPDQFDKLLEYARDDERIYPLVIVAAFTGMRFGDCCRLAVADVDLKNGMIDVVTSKAGVRCRIPIIDQRLRDVLTEHCAIPADGSERSPFAFPTAAARYDHVNAKGLPDQRTGLVRAVKVCFAKAVYGDAPDAEDARLVENGNETATPDLETAIAGAGFTEQKRTRVIEVYRRFKAGEQSSKIAEQMGVARGQVSSYLKDAERLTGERLRPNASSGKLGVADLLEKTRVKRTVGKHSASIWGAHSLRHNFITCALNANVPLHKVAAIVGQKTEAVTQSYADMMTDTGADNVAVNQRLIKIDQIDKADKADKANDVPALPAPEATAVTPVAKTSVDDVIAAMTDEQRKDLARKLLGL